MAFALRPSRYLHADFSEWPPEARAYYATRLIDWEVGNGGFRQARANAGELFPEAIGGYELIGRPDLADIVRRALTASDNGSLEALDTELGENDAERVTYVRAHAHRFRF